MPPRSARNQKIEPLDYTEIAQAPALKGSVSFLEITPGDVQSGFTRFAPARAEEVEAEQTYPGDETYPGYETASSSGDRTVSSPGYETKHTETSPGNETYPGDETSTKPQHKTVRPLRAIVTPIRSAKPDSVRQIAAEREAPEKGVDVSSPGDETYPGDETSHASSSEELTPGRGRSKVRRCVLAQDGHSLGEEAIYQVLWRTGRLENTDPNGSRVVRMGAADIGHRVKMAKKNVRQNISRLFEKLALEILEDFETLSSQARLYRVFSYKQILERRRAAGMEYILRNKGVVFCSPEGNAYVFSSAYVSSPGDETTYRPAKPHARRTPALPPAPPSIPATEPETLQHDVDLQAVSEALNRYWPVDHAAAVQLLESCRRIRPDARVSEITFFVLEKLELARQNRAITNPTGLILSTVPQSFAGPAFLHFRTKMEEQTIRTEQEAARRQQQEEELAAWIASERV